jgi:methyl-accepting chemotaxis protein
MVENAEKGRPMKIRFKLLLSFTTMIALLLVLGIFSYNHNASTTSGYREMLDDSHFELSMKAVQFKLTGMSNDERAFLLNGDAKFASEIAEKHKEVTALFSQIRNSATLSAADQAAIAQVEAQYLAYYDASGKVLALYTSGNKKAAEAQHFGEERAARKQLDTLVVQLLDQVEQELAADHVVREAANTRELRLSLLIFAGSLLAAVVIGFLLSRSITRPLHIINQQLKEIADGNGDLSRDINVGSKDEIAEVAASYNRMAGKLRGILSLAKETSIQVAASSEQLTASTEQTTHATENIVLSTQTIAANSEQEQRHVEEAVHSIHEMADGIEQLSLGNEAVSRLAHSALTASSEGTEAVRGVLTEMNEIHDAVSQTSEVILSLADRSQHINGITLAISDLAGRTNLLALNASIEAARAGEHGRGFAVVAQEIRKLADQSSRSAAQIAELIQAVVVETEQAATAMQAGTEKVTLGLSKAERVDQVFNVIQEQVADVTSHIVQNTSTTMELAAASKQIVAMVEGISRASNEVAASCQNNSASTEEQLATMEEISASSQALSKLAEELHDVLSRFKLD